jgi:hypothetical protein
MCALCVHQSGGQKAASANYDVHQSTNICHVLRKTRFPQAKRPRSIEIKPDTVHLFLHKLAVRTQREVKEKKKKSSCETCTIMLGGNSEDQKRMQLRPRPKYYC